MSKDKKVAKEVAQLTSADKDELVEVGLFYALCIAAQQGNTDKARPFQIPSLHHPCG